MPAEKFEMWKKKAAANKPKPKPLKSMILMKIWTGTISKQIRLKIQTLLRKSVFLTLVLKYAVSCNFCRYEVLIPKSI
jgi:hypothetical protein